jgi:Tol biopolymer transport system component
MSEVPDRLNAALEDRYRIERELGAGGMATVYLAEDLKHDRKVAIKVLKPELAAVLGAERFVQEIKTTAALSHPHILPLFDSGEAGGFLFYVMPYIQGETIREKLNRETQFGVDEAVKIATEVADALDYAHRSGVIHRDIKPENILLHDGRPMVMDFGIALAVSAAAGGRMTETGLSLGTPHYMSPEQATADKQITARSDVYSLASVLYEMLAGEPPHMGNSAQQIIMKIIAERAQPVTELRGSVPPNVSAALVRALEKLPADRFASAAEFAEALGDRHFTTRSTAAGTPTATPGGGVSRRAFGSVAAIGAAAVVAAIWGWARDGAAPAPVLRYSDVLLNDSITTFAGGGYLAISPDGQTVAYRAGPVRSPRLYLRRRHELTGTPLSGTEGATMPFFSPDGTRIGFCSSPPGSRICTWRSVPVVGGPSVTLNSGTGLEGDPDGVWVPFGDGASWGTDGWIYVRGPRGLVRIPEAGGAPAPFTMVDTIAGEFSHRWPHALPDGRGIVFIAYTARGAEIAVADRDGTHRLTGVPARRVHYVQSGHLAWVDTNGSLAIAPFDPKRLETTGESRIVVEGVGVRLNGAVDFEISASGTLLYSTSAEEAPPDEVVWVDRDGTRRGQQDWVADFGDLAMSPDGTRLAVSIRVEGVTELWIQQGESGRLSKLTYAEDGSSSEPAWHPDGRSVAYLSGRGDSTGIWIRRADASAPAQHVYSGVRDLRSLAWHPDGERLAFEMEGPDDTDLYVIRPGVDSVPTVLLDGRFDESDPAFSPDGNWLAFVGNDTGRDEVYVRPFPDLDGSLTQISSQGASLPAWSRTGDELLFVRRAGSEARASGDELASVRVAPGTPFAVDEERVLFSEPAGIDYWGVTPDGQRFAIVRGRAGAGPRFSGLNVIIVENWIEELVAEAGR